MAVYQNNDKKVYFITKSQPDQVPDCSQQAGCAQMSITNVVCFLPLSFLKVLQLEEHTRRIDFCRQN